MGKQGVIMTDNNKNQATHDSSSNDQEISNVMNNGNTDTTLLTTKKNALLLTAFAAVCTFFVALTHLLTKPVIEHQKQQNVLQKLTQVLDASRFDNNPLYNCTIVTDSQLTGSDKPVTVYRATKDNQPYAIIFQSQTPNGYNGKINMITAVDKNGVVQGVRTLEHQETPGLGDKIELAKSDWILSFANKVVKSDNDPKWFIKKDGGQFDQFTGATITPRAIVNQLRTSIYYATSEFENLYAAPNDCQAEAPSIPTASESLEPSIDDEVDS